jgi:NAD(P)-dependent dehydrogenase (short-subunit alcohol dehydrogenase family)
MAQDGFGVILNDLESKSELGQAAAKVISTSTGRPVIFMAGDVAVESDVDALVQRAVDEFGGLDVVSMDHCMRTHRVVADAMSAR